MLSSFDQLLKRYAQKLTSGSHSAYLAIQDEWEPVLKEVGVGVILTPVAYKEKTLHVHCSSSEEAALGRLYKRALMQCLNARLQRSHVTDIVFTPSHERTQ